MLDEDVQGKIKKTGGENGERALFGGKGSTFAFYQEDET